MIATSQQLLNLGKSKAFYSTNNPNEYAMKYLDNISSLTMGRNDTIAGTGKLRSLVSARIFEFLQEHNVPTHYIRLVEPGEMIVQKLDMMKLEIIPRNRAAGSICRKYPVVKGTLFDPPLIKLDLKYGDDPMLNTDYAVALGVATEDELKEIHSLGHQVNQLLKLFFEKYDLILVDFKFEVGKTANGKIIIGDEISCDGMRLWDKYTMDSIDKDNYRYGTRDILTTYKMIAERIGIDLRKWGLAND